MKSIAFKKKLEIKILIDFLDLRFPDSKNYVSRRLYCPYVLSHKSKIQNNLKTKLDTLYLYDLEIHLKLFMKIGQIICREERTKGFNYIAIDERNFLLLLICLGCIKYN